MSNTGLLRLSSWCWAYEVVPSWNISWNKREKLETWNLLQSPPGSCCTSSLCRTHSICRWTWCCRQRPGTRAAPPGRKQPISLPTSHSIFSLCCFFSHSFSRHPQLNFLIRCLSSLFAHSQHPPGPPLLPLFFITPFPKSLETFLSYQVIVFFLKLGIVVWLLILFTNIKQKMHIMGNSIKLNLT